MSTSPGRILRGERSVEETLAYLRESLFPQAVEILNATTLPFQCSRFDSDIIPTNQRNLTDVRTRMGLLLEYELGKSVSAVLSDELASEALSLTYVIANKFPDLAFRDRLGHQGVRFEVKALQSTAEEKSANFDTLMKDIRKGTDFVVVLVWEWEQHSEYAFRYPHVRGCFVFDAYTLAQMRDTYWLNNPPANVAPGRQGFDLTFGVNCNGGSYNREEGNYGKLMRIFEPSLEAYLPADASVSTQQEYYRFTKLTHEWGQRHVQAQIASELPEFGGGFEQLVDGHYLVTRPTSSERKLIVVGSEEMPPDRDVRRLLARHNSTHVMALNGKFAWKVIGADARKIADGRKPDTALQWAVRRKT